MYLVRTDHNEYHVRNYSDPLECWKKALDINLQIIPFFILFHQNILSTSNKVIPHFKDSNMKEI